MSAAIKKHSKNRQPAPHSALGRLVVGHPVLAFLIMVCALGWSTLIATFSLGLPTMLSASLGAVFGFALPAFLVTAATAARQALRTCWIGPSGGGSAAAGTSLHFPGFSSPRCSSRAFSRAWHRSRRS